jgi:hypothetical protein
MSVRCGVALSAAGSLVEGLEETLTLLDLRLAPRLRNTLSGTNAIESVFSAVAKICAQVKRWQGSDHGLRWVASAVLFAESNWNKIQGYRHMPVLVKESRSLFNGNPDISSASSTNFKKISS